MSALDFIVTFALLFPVFLVLLAIWEIIASDIRKRAIRQRHLWQQSKLYDDFEEAYQAMLRLSEQEIRSSSKKNGKNYR